MESIGRHGRLDFLSTGGWDSNDARHGNKIVELEGQYQIPRGIKSSRVSPTEILCVQDGFLYSEFQDGHGQPAPTGEEVIDRRH